MTSKDNPLKAALDSLETVKATTLREVWADNPETTVIHIKDAPKGWRENPQYLYIGRPSYLGNPFTIGRDGTREEVIEKYREHLKQLRSKDPETFDAYMEVCVRGKILVCYCAPQKCHGHVIVEYLNEEQL